EDELAPYYSPAYYGGSNGRFLTPLEGLMRWLQTRRARRVAALLGRPGRILDIGVGRAKFLATLSDWGWEVYGTEFSEASARFAREQLGLRVAIGDVAVAGHKDGSFDVITLWHVLEHLRDPAGTLRECRRLLRPGGFLVVAVPNADSLEARLSGAAWFHLDVPRHLHHFSERALRRILADLGCPVRRVRHFTLAHSPFSLLQSGLNLLGLPHNSLYNQIRAGQAREPVRGWTIRPRGLAAALLGTVLAPLALVGALGCALARTGGDIVVVAQKNG
ncbi:MAG: class I SAM-dependent methyltransferase, partial [Deltaproteobacteria bacterium]|nr:class I SAM-dependent methyltransferase [Deltaproteobacteria bacterium]